MNRFIPAFLAALPLAVGLTAGGCSPNDGGGDPEVADPSKLAAPRAGEGFQFTTGLFQVGPGEEIQDCYFYKIRDLAKAAGLPEAEPVNLHRIEIVQRDGSHHMNIFRVRDITGLDPANGAVQRGKNGVGECFNSASYATWPLIANTQLAGSVDWTFPDGVVNIFQPDEWIMLQSHYVNATSQKSPAGGEVAVNFHTLPKDQVKAEMGTLFATKQSIRICKSNPKPSFQGSCQFNTTQPVNIIGANGHFHGRGKQFDIFSWDGQSIAPDPGSKFYESRAWDEPPMLHSPDLNLAVPPGGGIQYACSYEWMPPPAETGGCEALDKYDTEHHKDAKPDCCYTFGPIVERNEHCNAFVYYWPKQDDINCF